ncbi:MAG: phenylalanine--tRNA ligase subunit alpha, partial [Ruaniaceae bacterium]|nr:phenylalanine--tRNA ligase subunit alpha [Ruaniaceae bacterium]
MLSPLDAAAVAAAVHDALTAIADADALAALKEVRIAHTGDKAPLTLANRAIGGLAPADKALAGKTLGQARAQIGKAFAARTEVLEAAAAEAMLREETVDVTTPADRIAVGSRHPLSLLIDEIGDFFTSMGWEISEGPELEHEWFNFDALNFGPDHPARQMQDTFFVDPPESHLVLRTHTSPVQARALLERDLPVYIA